MYFLPSLSCFLILPPSFSHPIPSPTPQLLTRELAEDGYAGVEVRVVPLRTEIIIRATRTQNVLGEKGQRIRELTTVIQKRFNFPDGVVELFAEKVASRGLCAQAQAESLKYKLLGGLAVRRAPSATLGSTAFVPAFPPPLPFPPPPGIGGHWPSLAVLPLPRGGEGA